MTTGLWADHFRLMTILDTIVAHKRGEVAEAKVRVPEKALRAMAGFGRQTLSLKAGLKNPAKTGIIAEFKRKSPSRGEFLKGADAAAITEAYNRHGASGLSVLTDGHFFGGGNEDLVAARRQEIPILRKDFIIDEYQVVEARAIGADVILLIAACLSPGEVRSLSGAAKALGLEVLLEIHTFKELGHVCDEVDLVGINNRDLKTFAVDVERSKTLAARLPAGLPKIAESGISDPAMIRDLRRHGFSGFLIGESFMKHADPGEAFRQFVDQLA